VLDLGSKAGTHVNGERISASPLRSIRIGDSTIRVLIGDP